MRQTQATDAKFPGAREERALRARAILTAAQLHNARPNRRGFREEN
jgi:hypothetical protein